MRNRAVSVCADRCGFGVPLAFNRRKTNARDTYQKFFRERGHSVLYANVIRLFNGAGQAKAQRNQYGYRDSDKARLGFFARIKSGIFYSWRSDCRKRVLRSRVYAKLNRKSIPYPKKEEWITFFVRILIELFSKLLELNSLLCYNKFIDKLKHFGEYYGKSV